MNQPQPMKLSIVIVNYNVKLLLEQCLLSCERAIDQVDGACELFVVDNDSDDGSVDYLKPRFPNVHVIANCDNVGFSTANNQALRLATGEFQLLLNPDTLVAEDTFARIIAFMEATPNAGAVGAKMIDTYGRFHPESKRSFPTPWNSLCKMFGLSKLLPNSPTFARYHLRYLDRDAIHDVDVLCGAFMMMRRGALQKSGLLDEAFFMYGEDIDLSYRIQLAGYRNYYHPAPILHYKGESTKKNSMHYVRMFYGAMLIFFRKHYPHYNLLFTLIIRFAIFLRASFSTLKRLFLPTARQGSEGERPADRQWRVAATDSLTERFLEMERNPGLKYQIELTANADS